MYRIPAGSSDLPLLHGFKSGAGALLAFFSRGAGLKQPDHKADISLHLMPLLRESGCIPPLPYIPSWRAPAQLILYLDKKLRAFYGAEIFVVVFTTPYPEPDESNRH